MDQEFELKLSGADINIILAGLQELPLKISAMVFNKIQVQVGEQQKPEVS